MCISCKTDINFYELRADTTGMFNSIKTIEEEAIKAIEVEERQFLIVNSVGSENFKLTRIRTTC